MVGYAPKKGNNTKYYDLLGVTRNVSNDEIKKAFRKAALKYHPDKGGDPEKFKEMSEAYQVVSDERKRQIYDQCSEEVVKGGQVHRRSDTHGRRWANKGVDYFFQMKVSLEDLYNGTTKKMAFTRKVICRRCKDKRSKSGASTKCKGCNGVHSQYQIPCQACLSDRCTNCKGNKVVPERKIVDVVIEKGMVHQQAIVFFGEADGSPDNVAFLVMQEENPLFKRKGNDLLYKHTISLAEALFGFQFRIRHLDGRHLLIKSNPGEVIKPGQFKAVYGEGMPVQKRPFMKGCLYIQFSVEFPETGSLTTEQFNILENVLPRPKSELTQKEIDECKKTVAIDVRPEEISQKHQQEDSDEDSDDGVYWEDSDDESYEEDSDEAYSEDSDDEVYEDKCAQE